MGYRDDLAAAQARIAQLEQELAAARQTIAELEAAPEPSRRETAPRRAPRTKRVGRLRYHPPRSYFPLIRLALRGPRVVWERLPQLPPAGNTMLSVLARALVWPVFHLVYWPLYLVALWLVVVPWSFVVACAGGVLILPYIVLSRITVGEAALPDRGDSAIFGPPNDDKAAGFLFFVVAPAPLFYPFTFALWRI